MRTKKLRGEQSSPGPLPTARSNELGVKVGACCYKTQVSAASLHRDHGGSSAPGSEESPGKGMQTSMSTQTLSSLSSCSKAQVTYCRVDFFCILSQNTTFLLLR